MGVIDFVIDAEEAIQDIADILLSVLDNSLQKLVSLDTL
jgi:hypothetical protein